MRIREEFSKAAPMYGQSNIIQAKVAQKLISDTVSHPRRVLDLGCGSGTLFSLIDWDMDRFVGVDFSQEMLDHHPKSSIIELILGDFNENALFDALKNESFDHIYSASALQWAEDLEGVLKHLFSLNTPISLAIFTSGTFRTLHECAHVSPLLKSSDEVIALLKPFSQAKHEIVEYTLSFDSTRQMFRYIKRSGVSAGRRALSISQTRELLRIYPLNYLEFEVVFITKN